MNYHSKAKNTKAKCTLLIQAGSESSIKTLPRKPVVLGRKEQRAEQTLQPAAGHKHNVQPSHSWERAAPAPASTHPSQTPRPAPRSVTRPATKIHSDPSATKRPREGVWMGQDLDFCCSSCACVGWACPGLQRGAQSPH